MSVVLIHLAQIDLDDPSRTLAAEGRRKGGGLSLNVWAGGAAACGELLLD